MNWRRHSGFPDRDSLRSTTTTQRSPGGAPSIDRWSSSSTGSHPARAYRVPDGEHATIEAIRATNGTVPARGAFERTRVFAAGALRRHPRRRATARAGPQTTRRRRHRTEHRRHGRLCACAGPLRRGRPGRHVRPTRARSLRGSGNPVRRGDLRRADAHLRRGHDSSSTTSDSAIRRPRPCSHCVETDLAELAAARDQGCDRRVAGHRALPGGTHGRRSGSGVPGGAGTRRGDHRRRREWRGRP